jgi:putative transposase
VAYHITQRGTDGRPVFLADEDRTSYLRMLSLNRKQARVRILAWCLMSNHIHLVAIPECEDSLEILLRRVHGRYAQMFNARTGRTGHLWQSRFFSCALDSLHLWRALAYVERNPVRAGLVERPEQYAWSSARVHLGFERDRYGLLDLDFWEEFGGTLAWRDLLLSREEAAVVHLLRRCTYSGRPFGEESFMADFEMRFGRRWRRWSFERGLLEHQECAVSGLA